MNHDRPRESLRLRTAALLGLPPVVGWEPVFLPHCYMQIAARLRTHGWLLRLEEETPGRWAATFTREGSGRRGEGGLAGEAVCRAAVLVLEERP